MSFSFNHYPLLKVINALFFRYISITIAGNRRALLPESTIYSAKLIDVIEKSINFVVKFRKIT